MNRPYRGADYWIAVALYSLGAIPVSIMAALVFYQFASFFVTLLCVLGAKTSEIYSVIGLLNEYHMDFKRVLVDGFMLKNMSAAYFTASFFFGLLFGLRFVRWGVEKITR